ncbi:MAG: hypothetical protein HUK02_00135, partial [Bacteroidaceae bacterium]|nr:hypothetical protein [Bacteroidaceae bacterium]
MKSILLSLVLVLSALSAMAERGTLVLRSPQEYQIIYISPNGKWAAGVYYDYSYNPFAFRWNLESDEIQMLSSLEISVPSGIANDGTVVGNYMATDISPNGAPVETPGYFTDRWHTLPMVGEFVPGVELFASMGGGIAGGISPDGRWMTGASYIEGKLHPMVWKDGQLYRDLFDGTDCVPYCISCDGSHIGGWKYITDDYGVRYSFVWNLAEESPRVLSRYGAPWCAAKQFTSDGKKVLMWNGWKNTLLNRAANMDVVYDVETQEMTNVRTISDNPANFDIFALADDGTILGYEADDGLNRAIIYKDGTPHFVTDYFKEQGIHDFFNDPYVFYDPEQFPYPVVQCGYAISADAKAMGFYHYEPTGYTQSSIVLTDQELTHRAPCGLKARGLRGEGTARVEWKAPLANAEAVQKYIVYRDGNAVAEVPATSRLFFDNNLSDGTYAYSVAATYADGTTSPATAAASAEVTTSCLQSPYAVFARQRGFQGAAIQWHAPRTNHITKGYFDDATDEIVGFGGGDNSFEVAIRIDREEMLQYKGQQIRAVQFYPMSAQLAWTLTIYEMAADGTLTTLHQQQVSETLALGQLNTIALDKTLNIGDLKNDIVVGVAPTVSSLTASYNVVGMVYGRCTSGVTDLLRLPIDPKFDSLYALAQQSATTNEVSWAIGLVIDNPKLGADADKVEKYNVFVDGALATTTAATSATLPQVAFGQRTVGVQAIYANGLQSTVETTQLSLSPDSELYGVQ